MELKLTQFVSNVELLTNIHNQNKNPIMFRLPAQGSTLGLLFYCAYSCPRYVVLPINAIWIDMNPESDTFQQVFKRTTKHASDPYQDVWTALYFYDDAMGEQTYDPSDLGVINTELPPLATSLTHGVGYLSYPESSSRVILEGDETLTDDRKPLDHTHPEKPATMLSINGTTGEEHVPIKDQDKPALYQVLVLEDDSLQWRHIREDELSNS
ncbi:putative T1SS secreted agglutinin RTX [Erwinia phage vB_EamM_Yoloswag]|uniref:Putative T1SS secreted agglutinin RTX n=1 Tax=Erwinia phage vB_EamM_Yoloswag TaxID=1958956 RepID=A0A1S6L372_9CAUD|nr:putative T1SS secreted agglutinin RTX [Erwinia phage vB_EamM_Yoloswag]AQT28634.1 putative T1SS secreted agglutinin RTX [Erwinia phage vB_EamM_Yoloswag]